MSELLVVNIGTLATPVGKRVRGYQIPDTGQ